MAQHIPLDTFHGIRGSKRIEEIKRIINNEFKDITRVRGSLKWDKLPIDYADKGEEAYFKKTKFPKSMVWGGNAFVEVHYNPLTKKITKQFMVA